MRSFLLEGGHFWLDLHVGLDIVVGCSPLEWEKGF